MTSFFAYNNMVKDMKLDEFKNFVKSRPYLVDYVKNNKMTWQKFYEIYDLYGENDSIWNDFKDNSTSSNNSETTNTNVDLSKPVTLFITIDKPDTPPYTILFGAKNKSNEKAIKAQPIIKFKYLLNRFLF